MGLKILHSADWHLDSPFAGFTQSQREYLKSELRKVPGKVAEVCIRENCDLVLLSGDIFDGPYSRESARLAAEAMARCGVPVLIAPGNHDYLASGSPWLEAKWPDNVYIFGQTYNQVIRRYAAGDYCAREWYEGDPNIRRAVDFLTSEEMLRYGSREHLERLRRELIVKDWFQTLPDFNAYVVRKLQAMTDYAVNPVKWRRMCLANIANAGFFSSDRTISEYNQDIWHLGEDVG